MEASIRKVYSLVLLSWMIFFSGSANAFSFQSFLDVLTGQKYSAEATAKNLTKGIKDDRVKVALLFDWITETIRYDTNAYLAGNIQPVQSTDELMRSKRGVCDDFAQLFDVMARSAGLSSTIVKGSVRNSDGVDGLGEHAWNRVLIDGKSYMVDTTWGAGYFDHTARQFVYRKDTRYLLAEPGDILLTHRIQEGQGDHSKSEDSLSATQFKQVQANTQRLASLGIPTQDLIAKVKSERQSTLPLAFNVIDADIKVITAPMVRPLSPGRYDFEFESPSTGGFFLRSGGRDIPFTVSGKTRSKLTIDLSGQLEVSVIYRRSNMELFEVLRY